MAKERILDHEKYQQDNGCTYLSLRSILLEKNHIQDLIYFEHYSKIPYSAI